ncbi:MAG: acyltransferase family protein [Chitinophagaceae bacterium]|jgi:predicted acyltransferase
MSSSQRFTALDVFRGMTVCFMIIVNNQGSGAEPFAPLEHAAWHGFTPTDLVFPSFLFAVGNAMAFTMPKFQTMNQSAVLGKIFKRTFLIFLIGYLLYWFPFVKLNEANEWVIKPIETTRIFGVLQRIALCYGAASLMIYYLSRRSVIILSVVFLLGYWLLMYLGGDYTMMGSFQIKADRWLIGEGHMYKGEGVPFDPEGFLSTFPSIVNVIIGYYAGVLLREKGKEYETLTKLLLSGAILLAIAYCWNYSFPINKKLWTGSFTLYTCGIDLLLISLLVYVLDKTNYKKDWTYFFEVFGKNPLFIYLLSDFVPIMFNIFTDAKGRSYEEAINLDIFQKLTPGPFGSFFYSASLMFFCWAVGYWMDKKKVYVRV